MIKGPQVNKAIPARVVMTGLKVSAACRVSVDLRVMRVLKVSAVCRVMKDHKVSAVPKAPLVLRVSQSA